jgi:hypothetical protein
MNTVTVTCKTAPNTKVGAKDFTTSFSKLPDETFGPYSFVDVIQDLKVSALLSPVDARNLVMDAAVNGSATMEWS